MFGVQQAMHLAQPRRGWDDATRQLDTLSHDASQKLGSTLQTYFRAGDQLAGGLVDTTSRLFQDVWSEPGSSVNEAWESLDRTRSRVREAFSEEEVSEREKEPEACLPLPH